MKQEYKIYAESIPAVADAVELKETFWQNGKQIPGGEKTIQEVDPAQIKDASDRLVRFAPYLMKVFPELEATNGIIESELKEIPKNFFQPF